MRATQQKRLKILTNIKMNYRINNKIVCKMQYCDEKAKSWSEAMQEMNINMICENNSPILSPLFLIKDYLNRNVPDFYIARYLNDYDSLAKTLIRVLSELLLVGILKVLKVKLFWICHNVDRESREHYPRISKFRRWIFCISSKKIFVLDSLLIPHAKRILFNFEGKIEHITFGNIKKKTIGDFFSGDERAIEFIKFHKKNAKRPVYVTLCAGAPELKSLHFDYLQKMICSAGNSKIDVIAIVAGNFHKTPRGREFAARYKKNEQIIFFEKYTKFSSSFLEHYIDFYFRGYSDMSVPFTVYEAVSYRKPILALRSGFLSELIEEYSLGEVLDVEFSNLESSFVRLFRNRDSEFSLFQEMHDWGSLGRAIVKDLDNYSTFAHKTKLFFGVSTDNSDKVL